MIRGNERSSANGVHRFKNGASFVPRRQDSLLAQVGKPARSGIGGVPDESQRGWHVKTIATVA
jgi:hypothetical protein